MQIGHRESIDLDLFSYESFNNLDIVKDIKSEFTQYEISVVVDSLDEYTCIVNTVKLTFLRYPFIVEDIIDFGDIKLASELSFGAMKAYALGRRSKWKDYVDLYILLQKHPLDKIIKKAQDMFGDLFSKKLLLQQLSYFKDIDYTESVFWRIDNTPSNEEIKEYLAGISTQALV